MGVSDELVGRAKLDDIPSRHYIPLWGRFLTCGRFLTGSLASHPSRTLRAEGIREQLEEGAEKNSTKGPSSRELMNPQAQPQPKQLRTHTLQDEALLPGMQIPETQQRIDRHRRQPHLPPAHSMARTVVDSRHACHATAGSIACVRRKSPRRLQARQPATR